MGFQHTFQQPSKAGDTTLALVCFVLSWWVLLKIHAVYGGILLSLTSFGLYSIIVDILERKKDGNSKGSMVKRKS